MQLPQGRQHGTGHLYRGENNTAHLLLWQKLQSGFEIAGKGAQTAHFKEELIAMKHAAGAAQALSSPLSDRGVTEAPTGRPEAAPPEDLHHHVGMHLSQREEFSCEGSLPGKLD